MHGQLLGILLFACQIILNLSSVVHEYGNSAINVTPTPARPAGALPEGYVSFPEDHAAYKVHKELVTWTEARDRCIAEGAHLAIADTVEKIKHIRNSTQHRVEEWISIGIYRSNSTNEWVGIDDGLPLTSLPWWRNPDAPEDCAGIIRSEYRLVSYSCNRWHCWYVCEIPI